VDTLDIIYADPYLSPRWRWNRARKASRGIKARPAYSDLMIESAASYLNDETPESNVAIANARGIFKANGLLRAELEARVMANEPVAEIADRCQISEEVVTTYETLFFDVRHFRESDWALIEVINLAHLKGFRNDQIRQFWSYLAIAGGEVVLQFAIDTFRRVFSGTSEPTLDVYLDPTAPIEPAFQRYLAIMVLSGSPDGGLVILDLQHLESEVSLSQDHEKSRLLKSRAWDALIAHARLLLVGERPKWKPWSQVFKTSKKRTRSTHQRKRPS